jgi:site-specific recombinase XerD
MAIILVGRRSCFSFRHAFATEMITSGQIDVKPVSSILGHSEVSTTLNIYTHEVQKVTAQALDFVSELIDSQRKQA